MNIEPFGPQSIGDWCRAVAVDANGDLIFAALTIVQARVTSHLPDLVRLGWSRRKRASRYCPDPNGWDRESTRYRGRPAVRLLVPRRYQWWIRLGLCSSPRELIEARVRQA
jgi:hypothetical protein